MFHKLKSRWEESYRIHKLIKSKKSAMLYIIHENKRVKKYHINNMKLFVARKNQEKFKKKD